VDLILKSVLSGDINRSGIKLKGGEMNSKKNWKFMLFIFCLMIVIMACGTGYTTTRTSTGDEGSVVLKIADLNGSDETQVEIDDSFTWDTLLLEITVEVEAGNFQAEFIDDEGQLLQMNATEEKPGIGKRNMVTDGLGNIILRSHGDNAENITITIEYTKME
jgi:hypothetical protein